MAMTEHKVCRFLFEKSEYCKHKILTPAGTAYLWATGHSVRWHLEGLLSSEIITIQPQGVNLGTEAKVCHIPKFIRLAAK